MYWRVQRGTALEFIGNYITINILISHILWACLHLFEKCSSKIFFNSSGGSSELMLLNATQALPILGLTTPNIKVKLYCHHNFCTKNWICLLAYNDSPVILRSLEKINSAYGIFLSKHGIQTICKIEFVFRESENIIHIKKKVNSKNKCK